MDRRELLGSLAGAILPTGFTGKSVFLSGDRGDFGRVYLDGEIVQNVLWCWCVPGDVGFIGQWNQGHLILLRGIVDFKRYTDRELNTESGKWVHKQATMLIRDEQGNAINCIVQAYMHRDV